MRTHARQTSSLAETKTTMGFSSNNVHVDFRAVVSPLEGQPMGHVVSTNPEVTIQSVNVRQDNLTRRCQWSRDRTGAIHILLDEPVAAEYSIYIQGDWWIPDVSPAGRQITLSPFRLTDSTTVSDDLTLVRDSSILVDLVAHPNLQVVSRDGPLGNDDSISQSMATPYTIANLLGDGASDESVTVRLGVNEPAVRGAMLTSLRQSEGRWWADVDYVVTFRHGVPDEFVFDIAPDWGESLEASLPLRANESAATTIVDLPDGRRRLIVRPNLRRNAEGLYLRLVAPVMGLQNVAAPSIYPISHGQTKRFLRLPTSLQGKSVGWETRLATRVGQLPDDLAATVKPLARESERTPQAVQYWELRDVDASATLRRLETSTTKPIVLCSEAELTLTNPTNRGSVNCFIDPVGNTQATVSVPAGVSLVAALVNDAYVRLRPAGRGRFEIPLVPHRITQQVQLIYVSGRVADNRIAHINIEIPEIDSATPYPTLWTIHARDQIHVAGGTTVKQLSLAEARQMQLRFALAAIDQRVERFADYSQPEIRAWFTGWNHKIRRLQELSTASNTVAVGDVTVMALGFLQVDAMLDAVSERLGIRPDVVGGHRVRVPSSDSIERSEHSQPPLAQDGDQVRHYVTSLNGPSLTIVLSPSGRPVWPEWPEWVLRLVLPLLFAAAVQGMIATPSLRGLVTRWSHAVPIILGFLWILYLRFPLVGIALIACGMLLSRTAGRLDPSRKSDSPLTGESTEIRAQEGRRT